jgi:molecular chaperone DnaK (HSP70)
MLTEQELKRIEVDVAGEYLNPEGGLDLQDVDHLIADHRALTAALANSRSEVNKVYTERDELLARIREFEAEQEKAWTALGEIAEYLEHSVSSDDWELPADVKNWLKECLEAKREMDADDRRSLDLFDA